MNHSDECLRTAARTGRSFCIAPCADARRASESQDAVTANQLAHFKDLWEQSCSAVAELCTLAGMPEGGMPDVWTLKKCIEDLNREVKKLRESGAVEEKKTR